MPVTITFVLFPMVTQLDFTGPAQVLSRIPDAQVVVAARSLEPVPTDCGFAIVPTATFDDAPQADLICVPGGFGVTAALGDRALMDFLSAQAVGTRYVTSVCTGSFLLGAAGLLEGRKATTHWAYTHLLPLVGARHEAGRVVRDGSLFTGGGVTAGIDFALTVAAELAGPQTAQGIQLALEYNPAPPFQAGHPDRAPMVVREAAQDRYAKASKDMRAALEAL